jgi:endonuclease YncB( thermonuclease family)
VSARTWLAAVVVALGLAAAACGTEPERVAPADVEPATPWTAPSTSRVTTTLPPLTTTVAPTTVAPTTAAPPPTTPPAPPTTIAAPTVSVQRVVDGDTLELVGGQGVRLIGIDTPEVGQCGYAEATAALRSIVAGRAVVLLPGARDDRDRYGRLLRYVEVGGIDANLLMILGGRAIARYDSRDGYGRHAREQAYVDADRASPSANVCGPAAPPTTLAPGIPGLDPRFGSCRDAKANGYGPYVAGRDPEYDWYRDGDSDGTVCE